MAQPKPAEASPSPTATNQQSSFFAALFQSTADPIAADTKAPMPGTPTDSAQAPDPSGPSQDGGGSDPGCPLNLSLMFEQLAQQLRSVSVGGRFWPKPNSAQGTACAPADSRKSRSPRNSAAPVRLASLTPKILTVLPLAISFAPSNTDATNPPSASVSNTYASSSSEPLAAQAGTNASNGTGSPLATAAPDPLATVIAQVASGSTAAVDLTSVPAGQLAPGVSPQGDLSEAFASQVFAPPQNGVGNPPRGTPQLNPGDADQQATGSAHESNSGAGSNVRTPQAEQSKMEFVRVQIGSATEGPANPSASFPKLTIPVGASVPNVRTEPNSVTAQPAVPAQMAAGVHTQGSGLHPSAQPQLAAQPQPAVGQAAPNPAITASLKSQTKDNSNGSESGDSEKSGKPGAPLVRVDGNGFSQSVEAANSNPATPHSGLPAGSPVAAVVDPRVSSEARSPSAEVPPDKASAGLPTASQPQPRAAAGDQPFVSEAQLIGRAGQSEIHIEMQAGPLGAVDLRAHLSGDQVGASIAVEHREAQLMLSNDLPALHVALAEKNLRVNTLSVSQGMAASTGGGFGSSGGQKDAAPFRPRPVYMTEKEIATPNPEAQVGLPETRLPGMRLSIRA